VPFLYLGVYLKQKFLILQKKKEFQIFLQVFTAAFLLGLIHAKPVSAEDQFNNDSKRTWAEFILNWRKKSSTRSWPEFFSESKTFLRAKRVSHY